MNNRRPPQTPSTKNRSIRSGAQRMTIRPKNAKNTGDLELQQTLQVSIHPPKALTDQPTQTDNSAPEQSDPYKLKVPPRAYTKQRVVVEADNKTDMDHPLGLPESAPTDDIPDRPKPINRVFQYSAQSYFAELSMLRNKELGCCFFSNDELIDKLSRKMRLWLDHQITLQEMSLQDQKEFVDSLYDTERLAEKNKLAAKNFADDPTGEILTHLKRELIEYIRNNERAVRTDAITCTYDDEKGVTRKSIAAGPVRQELLTDLQTKLRDINPQNSLLEIINQWKSTPTRYKKPNTNDYYTNYEFASEKTGWSQPKAKKIIDEHVALLLQATAKNAPTP